MQYHYTLMYDDKYKIWFVEPDPSMRSTSAAPDTCSLEDGDVVPIPTLPDELINNFADVAAVFVPIKNPVPSPTSSESAEPKAQSILSGIFDVPSPAVEKTSALRLFVALLSIVK